MKTERRFPPPWSVEDIGAAIVVRDRKLSRRHEAGRQQQSATFRAAQRLVLSF
jgi:hypothetical protein